MNENYKKIAIKCANKAEKLAALYHLSKLTTAPIAKLVLDATIRNVNLGEFPYVRLNESYIVSGTDENVVNLSIIEFKNLMAIEHIVNSFPASIAIGDTITVYKNHVMIDGKNYSLPLLNTIMATMDKLN